MITNLKINSERKEYYYQRGWWTDQTLNDVWSVQARKYSCQLYIKDDQGASFTYGEVDVKAARLASWMHEIGIQPGDIVSFQIPKWAEYAIVLVACLKIGAVAHPLPLNYSIKEITYAVTLVNSALYLCPTSFHRTNFERQCHRIASQIKSLKAILLLDCKMPAMQNTSLPLFSEIIASYEPYEETLPSKADEVVCVIATSGTTGTPKQALFTHNNILFSERSYLSVLDLSCDDIAWMPSPLNHVTGLFHGLIATMLKGASVVLELHFNAENAVKLINKEGCTWSHGATPFIYDLLRYLDESGESVPTLRFYLCGGAPVPSSLIEHAARYDILLCESYGSTESCPHIYVPLDKCAEWNGRWSGIPYEGIEVRVVDKDKNEVGPGIQGEEASRGPNVFVGYLDEPDRTNRALDDEGWFYSGDLCCKDNEGRIRINGRIKEIIIRGGENISTNEIDRNLDGFPGIIGHAAIGMPDERLGERICVFAVTSGPRRPTLSEICNYLEKMGVQKRLWPERIEFIDQIPHTATGKVKRYLLAEELQRRMKNDELKSQTKESE